MKNKITLFSVAMLFSISVMAQEVTKQERGYFNLTEIGYFFGNRTFEYQAAKNAFKSTTDGAYSLNLRNINGVFITNKISVGAGLSLENYTLTEGSQSYNNLLLLFVDARYYFKNESNTFFVYGDAGGAAKIADNFSKGTMFNLGIGYKFKVAPKTAMTGSFGYSDQTIKREPDVTRNRFYGFAVRAGILF
ncbi:hypothetical protein D3C85_1323140 [compost metagenome]